MTSFRTKDASTKQNSSSTPEQREVCYKSQKFLQKKKKKVETLDKKRFIHYMFVPMQDRVCLQYFIDYSDVPTLTRRIKK